jgi:hypothetical protein
MTRRSKAGFVLPGPMIEIIGQVSGNRFPSVRTRIECGGTAASRPFRAVFAVLTGWDVSGG